MHIRRPCGRTVLHGRRNHANVSPRPDLGRAHRGPGNQRRLVLQQEEGFQPPPPPTDEELAIRALQNRDGLLQLAALRIAPLQDAVDLDEATDEETAKLKALKQYRVDRNRIEQQDGWPQSIQWPALPGDE